MWLANRWQHMILGSSTILSDAIVTAGSVDRVDSAFQTSRNSAHRTRQTGRHQSNTNLCVAGTAAAGDASSSSTAREAPSGSTAGSPRWGHSFDSRVHAPVDRTGYTQELSTRSAPATWHCRGMREGGGGQHRASAAAAAGAPAARPGPCPARGQSWASAVAPTAAAA